MYREFKFENNEVVHQEICKIAAIENEEEAIVKAFYFQRYYAKALKSKDYCTGYRAIEMALMNIRVWIGNEDAKIASRIDFLWGNIPN